eukprot:COSAG01_NODE_1528_length_10015_cov_7.856797_1_plen_66_part_00
MIHPMIFTRTRNRPCWGAGAHLQQLKLNGLWVTLPNGDSFVVQEASHFLCACIGSPCLRHCVHGA